MSENMEEKGRAVAIDYETFYDSESGYSLSTMPTDAYCRDERFDPYLVAICGSDVFDPALVGTSPTGDLYRVLEDGRQLFVGRPERFPAWDGLADRTLLAHNASFDSVVTDELVRRGVLPERLLGAKWQCTADLSAFLLAPRNLKGAMKQLFGKDISKEVRSGMDGRHDWMLNDMERRALVEYGGSDAVECHDIWLKYSDQWPEVERLISAQNRDAVKRGVRVDREYAEAALKELRSYQAKVMCDIPWVSEINPKTREFYKAGSLPALRQAVIRLGVTPPKSFKKDDPGFLDWVAEHSDIPFIRARQVAVALAMHIARIEGILKSLDPAGNSHPSFLYFGAHTGRFSGKSDTSGVNTNLLNMPRKPVFHGDENVFGGKGVDIRGMYVPKPGHKFVVYDYSQIEARFALWLVGDTHMMEALKREGNLYQANAVAMGWCKSGDKIKKTNPDVYRLAKCCLRGDTLVLVRSERGGRLTSPRYKRIICVKPTDRVWDGHEWVRHLGVEKMKEVSDEELIEVGGVCLTKDHKVYVGESESRRADALLGDEEATAVAWGQANSPVQGWALVRILALALAGTCARAVGLCAREALHLLARPLSLHGVRKGSASDMGQREEGKDDPMHVVCSEGGGEEAAAERVEEDAR
jgi:hypothetical protein